MEEKFCLWGEQTDNSNFEVKLHPRLSAFAENMWLGSPRNIVDMRQRLMHHREDLRRMCVNAEPIMPQDCNGSDEQAEYCQTFKCDATWCSWCEGPKLDNSNYTFTKDKHQGC